ncbi:hypothetical protein W97_00507 [Coniosporium apollinis CBS 100218]|uniref:DDHD domain-containing protein n=1 Tax=Coniosporium apollinis (strain CBS 100218) TaxID=1168221 RepID=R7YHK9_CONA1|nr:uncharacterized protein W97_00507 [Coniosporium apollinis CBS 100218]EON61294.1 hypothetical protein W97_00507 [Coniosporium apollinis CBS 100218]
MASPPGREPVTASAMAREANKYIREILHAPEAPPPIPVRYFYSSPLALDDPLSPVPPPLTGSTAQKQHRPRPFSTYDNEELDKAWLELRRKMLKLAEDNGGEKRRPDEPEASSSVLRTGLGKGSGRGQEPIYDPRRRTIPSLARQQGALSNEPISGSFGSASSASPPNFLHREPRDRELSAVADTTLSGSIRALDVGTFDLSTETPATTGTPFIRAPSRRNVVTSRKERSSLSSRPVPFEYDSYNWDDDHFAGQASGHERVPSKERPTPEPSGPSAKVPVGVSRLHNVVMPRLQMEPIYWIPVNDIATVTRGTWFYKDTMLPVEVDVANMLEAGYVELRPWTQSWTDELNSAVEVGALGEMKVLHKLWPEKSKKPESRPGTAQGSERMMSTGSVEIPESPEKEREAVVEIAGDLIDISTGPDGPDNKAAGSASYGRDGQKRLYLGAGVIYATETEAYVLRQNLQPSAYYGRRPLANYIRKGRSIGICVVRGFDQDVWDKLHPPKKGVTATKAREGVSTSQAGAPPIRRQKLDSTLAQSDRPIVTDLVLVIHGIGQKLSERMESFHFTHAINAFRREVNVELGTDSVKAHLRPELGGIMVLPVNWRLRLSFEDGGYRDTDENTTSNQYTLKDITPDTLPSVRGIISDVMLDIPYYLSREHNPKMVAACISEANRIYNLWCSNNSGFAEHGRVHLIAHSLGSVMAVDILSNQPTHTPTHHPDPSSPAPAIPSDHFLFDTKSLFVCGSPSGFFLLLKKAALLPRRGRAKPGGEILDADVAGEQGTYGCLALDNIYNIVNPYDPVAYRLNATVDATYAAALKPAFVPSASTSWLPALGNPFRGSLSSAEAAVGRKPAVPRMPSNVELETHDFSREELAERKAFLLNDNGQIDWFLKYGGGALEIQYLTMLGAHSSYWISRDFVRFVVVEVGRGLGREGTVPGMRAVKRKVLVG